MFKCIGLNGIARCVSFINQDKHLLVTSQHGEIMVIDVKTGSSVLHEYCTGDKEEGEDNIIYCARGLKTVGDGLMFMTTHQDCVSRSWEFDPSSSSIRMLDVFPGHTNTVRYLQYSPSEQRFCTTCEDHSARIWDMDSKKGEYLLCGHTDF